MSQTIFKTEYIANQMLGIGRGAHEYLTPYLNDGVKYGRKDTLLNPQIPSVDSVNLVMPDQSPDFEFRNSAALYEALPITPLMATDSRLWTFLTHVTFSKYMSKRRSVEQQTVSTRGRYVIRHWFVEHVGSKSLLLNDISMLWWIAHLTADPDHKDKYRRTREVFTMLDYTRHLLSGTQGRNEGIRHGVLEFVIENKQLFSAFKAEKVRFIMRKLNFVAGYRVFSALSKEEIKSLIDEFKEQISQVKTDGKG